MDAFSIGADDACKSPPKRNYACRKVLILQDIAIRFDWIGKNDDDPHIPASMALGAYDSNWVSGNAWLGMPMSIGVQLASIVELVADMKDAEKKYGIEGNGKRQKVPSWIQEGFQDRGFAIEQRIKRKDFTRSVSGGDAGGVGEPPIGIVLGDLWKAVSSYGQCCGEFQHANGDNAWTDGVDRALPISVQLWTITPTPSRSICRDAANTKHHI